MNLTDLYTRDDMSIGTPTVADMDSDGDLELIATTTTGYSSSSASWTVTRMDLSASTPDELSWAPTWEQITMASLSRIDDA